MYHAPPRAWQGRTLRRTVRGLGGTTGNTEHAATSPWVRGPAWDALWMQSALWLLPLALWLASGSDDPEASPLDAVYCVLTALFWIGHRLCSAWLAYCTEAYRRVRREHPVRFVALPLLVAAACFGLLLPTDAALPWTRAERVLGLAALDYGWGTYHFAAQHFGALSIYRARIGRDAQRAARWMDRLFALGIGGVLVLLADVLAGSVAYQDLWIDRWLAPAAIASVATGIRDGAMLVLILGATAMLGMELCAPRRSLPRVLYVLGVAGMAAVALQPRGPFLFLVLWTSQHWIVATGLASQVPRHEPAPDGGVVRRFLHALNSRPVAVVALLVVASIVLLPVFEVEASLDTGKYYGDQIFGAMVTGLRTSSWLPILVSLGFATGFTHYLLDRSVFRLSDPDVRLAARGLLTAPEATERPAMARRRRRRRSSRACS
jgi:hypothetical protein